MQLVDFDWKEDLLWPWNSTSGWSVTASLHFQLGEENWQKSQTSLQRLPLLPRGCDCWTRGV